MSELIEQLLEPMGAEDEQVRARQKAEPKRKKKHQTTRLGRTGIMGRPRTITRGKDEPVKQLIIEVAESTHKKFKTYCELRGLSMSCVLRQYVEQVASQHQNTPEELREERFHEWFEQFKGEPGARLDKAMEMFRAITSGEVELPIGEGEPR